MQFSQQQVRKRPTFTGNKKQRRKEGSSDFSTSENCNVVEML